MSKIIIGYEVGNETHLLTYDEILHQFVNYKVMVLDEVLQGTGFAKYNIIEDNQIPLKEAHNE